MFLIFLLMYFLGALLSMFFMIVFKKDIENLGIDWIRDTEGIVSIVMTWPVAAPICIVIMLGNFVKNKREECGK